ncbi:TPA: hypothetical protein ACGF2K_003283, partial [Vibrio cholerae]
MAKILILYPHLFNCYSKFARKVGKITSSLNDVEFIYPDDPNQLIKVFCAENTGIASSNHLSNWSCDDITHAIVFDDGEEFISEVESLKIAQIPLRFIRIQITRVINIKSDTKYQAEMN